MYASGVRAVIPLIVAVVLVVAFAWSRVRGNLPSSFFRDMDRDSDFRVSYAEWQAEFIASAIGRSASGTSMRCVVQSDDTIIIAPPAGAQSLHIPN